MNNASPAGRYLRFLGWCVLMMAALLGAGFQPTRRLGGMDAMPAMLTGLGIGFLGAALAGLVVVASHPQTPAARLQVVFGAMSARLLAAVLLGAAAVMSERLARVPLLFWLAVSYIALLPLEVKLATESQ